MKECPHCHEESFGWRELFRLDYFHPGICKACGNLVRNDGFRQFLLFPAFLISIFFGIIVFSLMPDRLQPFAMLFFLVLLALPIILLAKPVKLESPKVDVPPFIPDANNDKVIIVSGWNEEELHKVLQDFKKQDATELPPEIAIDKRHDKLFRLTFPEDLAPLKFAALINYLNYPFDLDLAHHSIAVVGKTTLGPDFQGIPAQLAGSKAILSVPEDDQEYDVVYIQADTGDTFAVSFADSRAIWHPVNDAQLSTAASMLID